MHLTGVMSQKLFQVQWVKKNCNSYIQSAAFLVKVASVNMSRLKAPRLYRLFIKEKFDDALLQPFNYRYVLSSSSQFNDIYNVCQDLSFHRKLRPCKFRVNFD